MSGFCKARTLLIWEPDEEWSQCSAMLFYLPCTLLSGNIWTFFTQTLPRHHWRDSMLYLDLWPAFSQFHVISIVSDSEQTSGTTQPYMRIWNDRKHSSELLEVCTLLLLGLTGPFSISHKTAFKLFTNSPESIICGSQGRAESRRKEEESMLFCLKQQTCHQGVMWFDDCNWLVPLWDAGDKHKVTQTV